MKRLALDLGARRIGVSLHDDDDLPARPFATLEVTPGAATLSAIVTLLAREAPDEVIVGLPLNMDGSEGPRSQSSRAYARNLLALALPVLLWDERWSTASAESALIAQDMSRARRAGRIDAAAAAVILQAAIDALAGSGFG